MINKIKETLGQVFFSPEASGTWEEKIECAIDEVTVKCENLEAPIQECGPGHLTQGYGFFGYTGVPAPRVLEDDEWFGPAPISDANQDYMKQETLIKQQQHQETHSVEPEDIHQVMYEMATKNSPTTIQLDPIGGSETLQGGSENVHR